MKPGTLQRATETLQEVNDTVRVAFSGYVPSDAEIRKLEFYGASQVVNK